MRNTKKIWRDNTMPPTNYIWMRLDLKRELIGVYEWLNGHWHKLDIHSDAPCDTYSKAEIDLLLEYTEQEIARKIASGEYDIGIEIDDELSFVSANPVENRVITAELAKKLDRVEFNQSAIPAEELPWNQNI